LGERLGSREICRNGVKILKGFADEKKGEAWGGTAWGKKQTVKNLHHKWLPWKGPLKKKGIGGGGQFERGYQLGFEFSKKKKKE